MYLEISTAKISCTVMLLLYIAYCTYVIISEDSWTLFQHFCSKGFLAGDQGQ